MRPARVVTSFVRNGGRFLILRRSSGSRTMGGLWSGVSGVIEGDEEPLGRARAEILEETGMSGDRVRLERAGAPARISPPGYAGREWVVFPFLFRAEDREVVLNGENSACEWVTVGEMSRRRTVPGLVGVLHGLLRPAP